MLFWWRSRSFFKVLSIEVSLEIYILSYSLNSGIIFDGTEDDGINGILRVLWIVLFGETEISTFVESWEFIAKSMFF